MKINKIIFLLGCILTGNSCFAQNTGFMGKKAALYAHVNTNSNNVLLSDYAEGYEGETPSLLYYFDFKSSFAGEYCTSRRTMTGLNVMTNNLKYYTTYYPFTSDSRNVMVRVKTLCIGASIKVFGKSNSLTPLGVYNQFELGLMKYRMVDTEGFTGKKDNELAANSGVYVGYGIGRQQLLFDNFLIDIGLTFKISPVMGDVTDTYYFIDDKGNPSSMDLFPGGRMTTAYIFNARIGVGYLLF